MQNSVMNCVQISSSFIPYRCTLRIRPRKALSRPAACHNEALNNTTAVSKMGSAEKRRLVLAATLAAGMVSLVDGCAAGESVFDVPSCQDLQKAGNLMYCDLVKGSGDAVEPGDLVEISYVARSLATGKIYDGSKTFKFYVGQGEIVPGLDEAFLGNSNMDAMREGGQRTVQLPPSLAYGKSGAFCSFGLDDACQVPPDSPVEITFKYIGLRG